MSRRSATYKIVVVVVELMLNSGVGEQMFR